MGVAVVGGMVTSTVLTLIVIPMVYVLFAGLQRRRELPSPSSGSVGSV